jgi:hypothetical protein
MFKRLSIGIIILVAGIVIGGFSVEVVHRHLGMKSKERFEQRARCKSLSDSYARENTDSGTSVFIKMVDFSESQNTCIAAFNGWSQSRFEDWQLVDLLTQKTTYIGSCDIQKNCGEGRDMKFDSEMEAEFNRELDGTKQTKDSPAK